MLPPCARCGHSAGDHRMDTTLSLDPPDEELPFRCRGPHGLIIGCNVRCPEYRVGEVSA